MSNPDLKYYDLGPAKSFFKLAPVSADYREMVLSLRDAV